MDYEELILSKLLDKYEDRIPTSNRRVKFVCSKNEVEEIPHIESSEYIDFRDAMLKLKSRGFITIEWERPNYLIRNIYLNLAAVDSIYHYLERKPQSLKVAEAIQIIDDFSDKVTLEWIKAYLADERTDILAKGKVSDKCIWCKERDVISSFLAALDGIDKLHGESIHIRAFSVKTYSDSKKFEREVKPLVIPVIKNYEPSLIDALIDEKKDDSDRQILAQVGIIMMPETFEFCGNVRIKFNDKTVDFSPISKGACISSECVSDIGEIEIFDTDRILFIENKTNYYEYCLNSKTERELVVFHGGFYSPQRGEFFRKLCQGKDIPTYFWADIDYGGFAMFIRLKINIIENLLPFNMDIESYDRYKGSGLQRNDDYTNKLKALPNNPDYAVFGDVIKAIIENKVTVEQECFLNDEPACV